MKKLNHNFTSFAQIIIKNRAIVIGTCILIILFFAVGLTRLKVTVSIDSFFLSSDPLVKQRDHFENLFDNNDFLGLLVEADDVFDPTVIQSMHEIITEVQERVPYITSVTSIPTTPPVLLKGKSLRFKGDVLQSNKEEVETIRGYFDERHTLKSVLYSKGYKQAWILFRLEEYPTEWDSNEEPAMYVGRKTMEVIKEFQSDELHIYPTGIPVYAFRKSNEMMEDLTKILIIASLAALVCILFLIRSPMGILGSLLIMGGSIYNNLWQSWLAWLYSRYHLHACPNASNYCSYRRLYHTRYKLFQAPL